MSPVVFLMAVFVAVAILFLVQSPSCKHFIFTCTMKHRHCTSCGNHHAPPTGKKCRRLANLGDGGNAGSSSTGSQVNQVTNPMPRGRPTTATRAQGVSARRASSLPPGAPHVSSSVTSFPPQVQNVPSSVPGILRSTSSSIDNTQTVSQFPNVHQNVHAGLMSHNYNVPSVYNVGQNIPASVSQTGSQSVQTPHNLPSVYGVGQNYITSAAQPQSVFQPQLPQTVSLNMSSVSQFQHVPQNVPSGYSVGQNGPASVSQTGSQSVQTPHNLPSVYGVGQNYITSAAQPLSIFQPQLPQTASHSMPSVFGVGQDMCHMQFNMINVVRTPLAL